jgi:precorrin-4 C11-methyltransferase
MTKPRSIALIAVTRKGVEQARLLRQRLRTGKLYRPSHYGVPEHAWELFFEGPLADQVPAWFTSHDQLVFFLASGAVTRLIARCLASKESDPGVLAVDEAGHFVIPLLSGHRGGANTFARMVAGCLGATPVVTTASDVIGGLSLDTLEDALGWTAEPREMLKGAALALVNQEPVAILQEVGARGAWLDEMEVPGHVAFVHDPKDFAGQAYSQILWVTDQCHQVEGHILWLRPKSLVLGVGCERGLSAQGLEQGLDLFLRQQGFARASIDTLASVDVKADEPALLDLADREDWQTAFFPSEALAEVPGIASPSAVVERCVGTPGVAEPAALLAAGATALLVAKQVIRVPGCSQAMTFALARHQQFQTRSKELGKVYFVGAGPGDDQLLTLKAYHLLKQAEVVIYAGSLIPQGLLRHVRAMAVLHDSAPLTLEQVMDITLKAVRSGRRVLRLQSGDTSIYSAIQEQIAILEKEKVDFEVVPGISSYQALAAALKSEFTLPDEVQTIILTRGEGQTPMPAKESLAALARHQATLCIFLSARLAAKVQEQLLTAYPPETPVAIGHRVSWPDECLVTTRLDRLADTMKRHDFQRTTLIAVGTAIGGRRQRSHLYDERHGHIFRKRRRAEDDPAS